MVATTSLLRSVQLLLDYSAFKIKQADIFNPLCVLREGAHNMKQPCGLQSSRKQSGHGAF